MEQKDNLDHFKPEKHAEPLVSIIVITYNSARFVLETLESAKAQTYQNIELIVSDDGSTDDTVEICHEWIGNNKGRFARTELITVPENTGIPANCNRALKMAKGEWIKYIAADDVLLECCIEDNVSHISLNNHIKVLQSDCKIFFKDFIQKNFIKQSNLKLNDFFKEESNASDQYALLSKRNFLMAPAVFIFKPVIEKIGGFDEDFHLIEDYPLWINLLKNGIKIYYLEKVTVKYRIHDDSIIKSGSRYMSEIFANEHIKFNRKYLKHARNRWNYYRLQSGLYVIVLLNKIGLNNNSFLSRILFRLNHDLFMK